MPKKKQTKKPVVKRSTRRKRVAKLDVDPTNTLSKDELDPLYEIADDADKYHALKVVAESDGGAVLVDALVQDVVATVSTLAGSYKELSLQEFISLSARMSASLSLVRSLSRAEENLKGAEDALDEALRE